MEGLFGSDKSPETNREQAPDVHSVMSIGELSQYAQSEHADVVPESMFEEYIAPEMDCFPKSLFTNILQADSLENSETIYALLVSIQKGKFTPENQRKIRAFAQKHIHANMENHHWLGVMGIFGNDPEIQTILKRHTPPVDMRHIDEVLSKLQKTPTLNEHKDQEFLPRNIHINGEFLQARYGEGSSIEEIQLRADTNWKLGAYTSGLSGVFFLEHTDGALAYLTESELNSVLRDENQLKNILKEALKNHKKEQGQKEKLKQYDLPNGIDYVQIFPQSYDPTLADTHKMAILKKVIFQKKYQASTESIYSDQPLQMLEQYVQRKMEAGVKNFFIDIYQHGQEGYIDFSEHIDADDLQKLIEKHPDGHFTLSTVACHGGGLREDFLQAQRQGKKIPDVLLQTKPNIENKSGLLSDGNYSSSYHEIFLLSYLKQHPDHTLGQALAYADENMQRYSKGNAESIIDGELFVQSDWWNQRIEDAY